MSVTPVYIAKWIHIVLLMRQGTEYFENTFSYSWEGAGRPSVDQLLDIATRFWGTAPNPFTAAAASTVQFISVTARDRMAADGLEAVFNIPANTFGGLGGQDAPLSVCGTVSERTAIAGRAGRGRIFWSGLDVTKFTTDLITSAGVTLLGQIGQFILLYAGGPTTPVQFVVASRAHVLLRRVLTIVIKNIIDVQKRRLPAHRRHKHHV